MATKLYCTIASEAEKHDTGSGQQLDRVPRALCIVRKIFGVITFWVSLCHRPTS